MKSKTTQDPCAIHFHNIVSISCTFHIVSVKSSLLVRVPLTRIRRPDKPFDFAGDV
jgi:hypothetical protein